jgi:hypothetical protein
MAVCKNCGGSNKKVILNYTPKSYTICSDPTVCTESYNCSEILDATCIQYTAGDIIYCGTTFSVVNNFENLENALQNILDVICRHCQLTVNIIANTDENNLPSLTSEITNGEGPYTYQWEIAQGEFVGHFISGSTTLPTLNLTCIAANSIRTGDIDKNIKVSNIKLTVTDSKGCKETVHFVYTSDCYSMIIDPPQETQPYLGGRLVNTLYGDTQFAVIPMDFMNDPRYMPTCTELKNICCVECFESYSVASTSYRRNRDEYFKSLNENLINEQYGTEYLNTSLNFTQWDPGNIADQLILYKGGLENYNYLSGCPECSFRVWSEIKWPTLNNKTLAEIFPMINLNTGVKFVWLDAVQFGEIPPTGQPGQLIKWGIDPLDPTYLTSHAWDPTTNSWSSVLADVIDEINTPNKDRTQAWLKAFNELVLATVPFVWANDYALFHRYKYELKYTV